jgi:hypothetical protein
MPSVKYVLAQILGISVFDKTPMRELLTELTDCWWQLYVIKTNLGIIYDRQLIFIGLWLSIR